MRISTSLTLWLVGIVMLILGLHGLTQLATEEAALLSESRRELTLIATAIRSGVENAVRDGQRADLVVLLDEVELKDPTFDVFIFDSNGESMGRSWGSTAKLARARALAQEHRNEHHIRLNLTGEHDLSAVAPYRFGGKIAGQVVIFRPSNAMHADLRQERNAALASILALAIAISIMIWAVINVRLQRPISKMIAVVHRVAAGDLSARIHKPGKDELAILARELDGMVEALENTRSRLAQEAGRREKLESEMLRANRLAIVGELAATLAHEVGSPLQVLAGRAADIARRQDLPSDASRSAAIIEGQVDRINDIVERFLDVARRKAPVVEEVNVKRALSEVTELVGSQYRRMGVLLDVQAVDCTIWADPAQVQQVLLNLLQNALRASPYGATVRTDVEESSFQRFADGPIERSIKIAVEDEGSGIQVPPAVLFQPFFSGWENESGRASGTGLGLSVVRTIMTDHGGIVSVERATRGSGARFVLHFPTRHESSLGERS